MSKKKENQSTLSVKAVLWFVVLFQLSYKTTIPQTSKGWKCRGESSLEREWLGLCFCRRPRRGGWQSHRRFTSWCSLLFKRMHKGVCLMIYYLMLPWKSKWILESAQLLNPDLEECDLCDIRNSVCSTGCLSKHVWNGMLASLSTFKWCEVLFKKKKKIQVFHEMLFSQPLSACHIRLFNQDESHEHIHSQPVMQACYMA